MTYADRSEKVKMRNKDSIKMKMVSNGYTGGYPNNKSDGYKGGMGNQANDGYGNTVNAKNYKGMESNNYGGTNPKY